MWSACPEIETDSADEASVEEVLTTDKEHPMPKAKEATNRSMSRRSFVAIGTAAASAVAASCIIAAPAIASAPSPELALLVEKLNVAIAEASRLEAVQRQITRKPPARAALAK